MKDRIMIYFDNNATTQMSTAVTDAMRAAMSMFGNPSSPYSLGEEAQEAIEGARCSIAKAINCEPDEIVFTSGGTEANNLVIHTFQDARIAYSAIEHSSILCPLEQCRKKVPFPVDHRGKIVYQPFECELITVMLANNEIGTIQDIRTLVENYPDAYVHTDATQALGKMPVDVKVLGVDYMTISAHKIHGPKGIGALYVKKGAPLTPLITGGYQEKQRRGGTENFLGIIAFGAAVKALDRWQIEHIAKLRARMLGELSNNFPNAIINGGGICNTISVTFPEIHADTLSAYLESQEIYVSRGSACETGSALPSHVLEAIGADTEHTIRISFSRANESYEISLFIEALKEII